jgi:hypothetical protein
VAMSPAGGSTWTVGLGPFGENTVDGGVAWAVTLTVTATDPAGNQGVAQGGLTLHDCTLI